MSNAADHEAEQARITAACEAGLCGHPNCGPAHMRGYLHEIMVSDTELATILAALRFWQREAVGIMDEFPEDDIASNSGELVPLTSDEIDAICDRINNDY